MNLPELTDQPVGTIFEWTGNKFKICKDHSHINDCVNCAFNSSDDCWEAVCSGHERQDKLHVHFKEVLG